MVVLAVALVAVLAGNRCPSRCFRVSVVCAPQGTQVLSIGCHRIAVSVASSRQLVQGCVAGICGAVSFAHAFRHACHLLVRRVIAVKIMIVIQLSPGRTVTFCATVASSLLWRPASSFATPRPVLTWLFEIHVEVQVFCRSVLVLWCRFCPSPFLSRLLPARPRSVQNCPDLVNHFVHPPSVVGHWPRCFDQFQDLFLCSCKSCRVRRQFNSSFVSEPLQVSLSQC